MNSDLVLIFLFFLIALLFYLAIKYFKILFFYLWVFLWIFIGVFWKIFLDNSDFKLWFLKTWLNSFSSFFVDSKIVNFFIENLKLLFLLLLFLLFHKLFYYLWKILIYFIIWFFTTFWNWLLKRKKDKNYNNIQNHENNNIEH
jgi:hypothetical protein